MKTFDFPEKCGYCGKDITPHLINTCGERGNIHGQRIFVEYHACIHCKKPIFVLKKTNIPTGTNKTETILTLPFSQLVDIPQSIINLSPDAVKCYQQALTARAIGFDYTVGAALRISLEILVGDYLEKMKGIPRSKIDAMRLVDQIRAMNCDTIFAAPCASVIRIYGNGVVHFKKSIEYSQDEAFSAFENLCKVIDLEIQSKALSHQHQPT